MFETCLRAEEGDLPRWTEPPGKRHRGVVRSTEGKHTDRTRRRARHFFGNEQVERCRCDRGKDVCRIASEVVRHAAPHGKPDGVNALRVHATIASDGLN